MIKDRLEWEDALKDQFEYFLKKVEVAKVPDAYTLTFLKAEVEKLENHLQKWIDVGKDLYTRH